jgi:hypothetical protein
MDNNNSNIWTNNNSITNNSKDNIVKAIVKEVIPVKTKVITNDNIDFDFDLDFEYSYSYSHNFDCF